MSTKMIVGICAIYILIGLMGCEGRIRLSGRITDSRNSPIKDAKIILKSVTKGALFTHSDYVLSDEKGNYSIGLTHAPTKDVVINLQVSKEGYKSHNENFKGGTNNESLNITLKPEE